MTIAQWDEVCATFVYNAACVLPAACKEGEIGTAAQQLALMVRPAGRIYLCSLI